VLGLIRIKKLQNQVDEIDSKIIQLLQKRFELVREIAEIQDQEGIDLIDSQRDQTIIDRAGAIKGPPEAQLAMMRVFRAIIDWSNRCYLKKIETQDELLH